MRAVLYEVHAPAARSVALAVSALTPAPRNPLGDPEAIRRAQAALGGARALVRGGPVRPLAHVVLVTVDALRADRIGRVVQGRSLTPNLDAMDRDTVIFDRAITQAPHSSYAISSLHTGEYLHETIPLGQRQPLPTLADTLRARGFNTVGLYTNGIFFTEGERLFAYRDSRYGFARASHVDHDARAQTDAAITELDDAARRGGPTLLWVHYFDVHAPYWGHGDSPEARYDDAVRRVDGEVARLLGHARRVLQRGCGLRPHGRPRRGVRRARRGLSRLHALRRAAPGAAADHGPRGARTACAHGGVRTTGGPRADPRGVGRGRCPPVHARP